MIESGRVSRVFCASAATETNTFSPLRTDIFDFRQSFFAEPGAHPDTPMLRSAVFTNLRERAKGGEVELAERHRRLDRAGWSAERQDVGVSEGRILDEGRPARAQRNVDPLPSATKVVGLEERAELHRRRPD